MHPRLPAAAGLALAASAGAQCIWTRSSPSQTFFSTDVVVYHSGLQRVLLLESTNVLRTRTWAWASGQWDLLNAQGPTPRTWSAAAYDPERDRVVLFGGADDVPMSDTWEWDRTTWALVPAPAPPARSRHAMVYDAARHRTVVFGGQNALGNVLGDTWDWDGQAWTPAATVGPSARADPRMVYDSVRHRTILYGGHTAVPGYFSDVWEWDGIAWAQRATTTPGLYGSWMAFDPARARLALGGYLAGQQQTWEMSTDTGQWYQRPHEDWPTGPAAFDAARARAVIVGNVGVVEYNGAATTSRPRIIQQPVGGVFAVGGSATLTVVADGGPLQYQWLHAAQPLTNGGNISGATSDSLTIDPLAVTDGGQYEVLVWNACDSLIGGPTYINFSIDCYANCDGSTATPLLNINDFLCFLNRFASGDPWANCDGSCNPICLSIQDFGCFLNRFANGCT